MTLGLPNWEKHNAPLGENEMERNLRKTYAGFILLGYSHNLAAYETAKFWNVSYDYCRELLRPHWA